jgi:hypothetical protein
VRADELAHRWNDRKSAVNVATIRTPWITGIKDLLRKPIVMKGVFAVGGTKKLY